MVDRARIKVLRSSRKVADDWDVVLRTHHSVCVVTDLVLVRVGAPSCGGGLQPFDSGKSRIMRAWSE